MLWLALFLPELPLEVCTPRSDEPCAVIDKRGPKRWIVASNASARSLGLRPGVAAATALAIAPHVRLIERSRRIEKESLEALAGWAEQYSGFVSFDADRLLLWLEIGTSLRYFAGLSKLVSGLSAGLVGLGHAASVGIAPTLEAAALLATVDDAPPVTRLENLAVVLGRFPVAALAANPATLDGLRGAGLDQIQDVLALPRDGLARRFGPDITRYLQLLLGEQPDPRKAYRAPQTYRRRFELLGCVETVEALLFPLRRLLSELQGYLRARDTAIQSLALVLRHDKAAPDTHVVVRTTRPLRDAGQLYGLMRESLERVTLPAPVDEIILLVDRFVAPGETQVDLFDVSAKADDDWSALLDKLTARLGTSAVRRLGLRNDHRPERAWCVVADGERIETRCVAADRPLWLLEPKRLDHLPPLIGRPERIEAGWWENADTSRDYYIAETAEGSRWWLYREMPADAWYLHGLWA